MSDFEDWLDRNIDTASDNILTIAIGFVIGIFTSR